MAASYPNGLLSGSLSEALVDDFLTGVGLTLGQGRERAWVRGRECSLVAPELDLTEAEGVRDDHPQLWHSCH